MYFQLCSFPGSLSVSEITKIANAVLDSAVMMKVRLLVDIFSDTRKHPELFTLFEKYAVQTNVHCIHRNVI